MQFTYTVRLRPGSTSDYEDLSGLDDTIEPALPGEFEYDGCQYEEDDELHVFVFSDLTDGEPALGEVMGGLFGAGSVLEIRKHQNPRD